LYYKNPRNAMAVATRERTLNVRIPAETHARLSQLVEATGRNKSFLALQALETYMSQQAWQIAEVKAGIEEADRGEFATDEEMNLIFSKYAS
jgi:RHH-type transcriptional regulator, rel operon repressor / antitoxin RelB